MRCRFGFPAERRDRWWLRSCGDTAARAATAARTVALLALLAVTCWAGDGAGPKAIGWRGDGTGQYASAEPPTQWDIDEKKNILWQTGIGKGQSTPVVVADRVFVTAEQDLLLCLDRKDGKVMWKADNGPGSVPPEIRMPQNRPPAAPGCGYATPSPVSDGSFVYANYGTGIVVCYGLDGKRKWIAYVGLPQVSEYGRSASPVLAGGKLLVTIGGLVGLDPQSGKTLWTAVEAKPSFGTPAAARIGEVDVAITPNGDIVRLADGKILASGLAKMKYVSPIVHDGVVYFADATSLAYTLPPKADEPLKPEKLWENEDLEGEFFSSPICHEGLLYTVSNQGTLYALDAKTGKEVWKSELQIANASGRPGVDTANVYPSLTLVGKHLLLGNDIGTTLLLAPGREYKEVARNALDKGCGASPVPDGKQLFLRGGTKLYCISSR